MYKKQPKPKLCPCTKKFTPRGVQKYCSPACEIKFKTGRVDPENKLSLPLQVLRDIAVGTFQDYIKQRDKDKGCYTCPETKGVFHAGHAFAKNQFSGMILNEKACKKVCDTCNLITDTDGKIMQDKLLTELGIIKFIELENEACSTKYYRWSKIEFIDKIDYFNGKILELKSASKNAGPPVAEFINNK